MTLFFSGFLGFSLLSVLCFIVGNRITSDVPNFFDALCVVFFVLAVICLVAGFIAMSTLN